MKKQILLLAAIGCCISSAYAQDACSNVASGKPATASNSTVTETPDRAFDGNTNTNWCAPGTTGWIAVDLQDKHTVNSVKLYVNQAITEHTVQEIFISDDMENWILVETLSGSTSHKQILTVNFNPALSDVHRVKINTTNSYSWVSWDEIEVISGPEKPTIIKVDDVLTSSSTTNNQWYLNGDPIPDATAQSYTATITGDYQVGVSNESGCESMSDVVNFIGITTGINKFSDRDVKIYPNPTTDIFMVEGFTSGKIELFNFQGQVIKNVNVSDARTSLDITNLTNGIYSVKITTNDGIYLKKLIKQ